MASSYRRNFIETEGGLKNVFAHKVFCGWDYGIATKKAADLKSSSLYLEMKVCLLLSFILMVFCFVFKELLSDTYAQSIKKSCLIVFWSRTIQCIVNLFIVVGLIGIGYLVWIYLERENSIKSTIVTPILISIIVLFLPLVFGAVVK